MKVRTAFVANSSSSSFIIRKADIPDNWLSVLNNLSVLQGIAEHKKIEDWEGINTWNVTETEDHLIFSTIMDNTDLRGIINEVTGISIRRMDFDSDNQDW